MKRNFYVLYLIDCSGRVLRSIPLCASYNRQRLWHLMNRINILKHPKFFRFDVYEYDSSEFIMEEVFKDDLKLSLHSLDFYDELNDDLVNLSSI